jgi:hypothetical protein
MVDLPIFNYFATLVGEVPDSINFNAEARTSVSKTHRSFRRIIINFYFAGLARICSKTHPGLLELPSYDSN